MLTGERTLPNAKHFKSFEFRSLKNDYFRITILNASSEYGPHFWIAHVQMMQPIIKLWKLWKGLGSNTILWSVQLQLNSDKLFGKMFV